jgi:hypothetical protein
VEESIRDEETRFLPVKIEYAVIERYSTPLTLLLSPVEIVAQQQADRVDEIWDVCLTAKREIKSPEQISTRVDRQSRAGSV